MTGRRGGTGEQGKTGRTGATGARGGVGASGRVGATGTDRSGLTSVHDHIGRIHKELSIQMQRMAQLQAEIDALRLKVERMMGS